MVGQGGSHPRNDAVSGKAHKRDTGAHSLSVRIAAVVQSEQAITLDIHELRLEKLYDTHAISRYRLVQPRGALSPPSAILKLSRALEVGNDGYYILYPNPPA